MACKVSQWLRLPQDMQSSPSQPEERGSLKRVKFNSNMPQCTAGWRRELVPRRGGVVGLWGVLWNSNWNLPLAIGSVVKCAAQRIKSQLKAKLLPVRRFASSPVAIAAALSLVSVPLSASPSMRRPLSSSSSSSA